MQFLLQLFIYIAILANCALSYNIDVRKQVIRYLLSPHQQELHNQTPRPSFGSSEIQKDSSPVGESGPLPSQQAPAFFGYDFNIFSSEMGYSLLVGAPKTGNYSNPYNQSKVVPYSTTGDVQHCSIRDVFTSSLSPRCPSAVPPTAQAGDAFGISLGASLDGRLTACTPPRMQDCTASVYSPGYCYNRKGNADWKPDAYTRRLACPSFALDLMFVLDGSGSVGEFNFNVVKNWVKAVARSFNIQDGSTRIGVIQYSHFYDTRSLDEQPYIKTEIALGEFHNQENLFEAVDNITLSGFTTYTAHALNKSVLDFMASDRFNDSAKVLILLTDGKSSDTFELPETAAYVRSLGINTFAVGVGNADVAELQVVATGTNSNENVYYVSKFDQLAQIVSQLKTAILTVVLEGSQSASTAALTFQVAEAGFSIHPSKRRRGTASVR